MAKGSRTGYRNTTGRINNYQGSINQSHTKVNVLPKQQVAQPPQAPQVPNISAPNTTGAFTKMSDSDALKLRTAMDSYYDPDVVDALRYYTSAHDVHGDGFSYSQNLNYKLDNNLPLDANEDYINRFLQGGMHDLGKNYELTRYAHDDLLQQLGIKNYANMTEAQLKKRLVGQGFQTKAYTSYSYDTKKNPFSPGAPLGGGRELTVVTKAKGDAKVVFGAKSQSEIVMNKGTKHRIVDVYYDGTTAYPRGKSSRPRLVVVTETF